MKLTIFFLTLFSAFCFLNSANAQAVRQRSSKPKVAQPQVEEKEEQEEDQAQEASTTQKVFDYTGVGVGAYLGFGIGHVFQLRYWDDGWKFTLIDVGAFITVAMGFGDSYDSTTRERKGCSACIPLGLTALMASHIWQAVDLWQEAGTLRASLQPEAKFRYALLPNSEGGASLMTSYRF